MTTAVYIIPYNLNSLTGLGLENVFFKAEK